MKASMTATIGLVVAIAGAMTARAQVPETATFYLMIGSDTFIVERSVRTPTRLRFELFETKRHGKTVFDGTVSADGLVETATTSFFASDRDTIPAMRVGVRFLADSVGFEKDGATNWLHVGQGTLPYVNPSAALLEQTLLRARALGGASASFAYVYVPVGPTVPVTVTWIGADSAVVAFAGVTMRAAVSPAGRLLGATMPSQNGRIVRGVASSGEVARRTYTAPAGAPYSAQDVVVHTKAGLTLTGTLTLPVGAQRRVPAIVTITGTGTQDRDEGIAGLPKYGLYRELADTLGRRGIAVLRLDDRGINGSDRGPLTATTADFADDIRAGVAFLRGRSEIDPRKIGLVGHSEGGYIAPMVAASDTGLAGIVILAGSVSTGRELLLFQQRFAVDSMAHLLGQQRDAALAQYAHNTDSVAAAIPWMKFFLDYDGTATAARVRSPVLILHGAKDYQVPVVEAEKTARAIRGGGNRDVTVKVFPATNHLFVDDAGVGFSYEKLPSFAVRPEVLGAIADWLSVRLKP